MKTKSKSALTQSGYVWNVEFSLRYTKELPEELAQMMIITAGPIPGKDFQDVIEEHRSRVQVQIGISSDDVLVKSVALLGQAIGTDTVKNDELAPKALLTEKNGEIVLSAGAVKKIGDTWDRMNKIIRPGPLTTKKTSSIEIDATMWKDIVEAPFMTTTCSKSQASPPIPDEYLDSPAVDVAGKTFLEVVSAEHEKTDAPS